MAKRKIGYLIFDLPSDHEVEESLSTECDSIQAIISNKGMAARVKRIKVASPVKIHVLSNIQISGSIRTSGLPRWQNWYWNAWWESQLGKGC